ncbi:molecular chaperone DjiA [Pikeienuella sp. HZG-20]|uniref:molecular chaperone DjiA n=1 Tax=Paludibacillus litoralis TaxID=3133267 RepID=UPI0030EC32D0
MSIWSRIAEAVSALAKGESLSAVFAKLKTPPERSVGFTIAVIALGAKMAKADGRVTPNEVTAFREVFHIPPREEANAARVFNLARNDIAGFDGYARQISRLFGPDSPVLEDVLEGLFHIALADGAYHPAEDEFLAKVASIFGVSDATFQSIRARYSPEHRNPYAVLQVTPDTPLPQIRRRWREIVRETHPDRMIARGVPEEAVKMATRRLAEVNAAYEAILAKRAA